mgnify:CR=1 FL=1
MPKLIADEMVRFFDKHKFSILLNFDGQAQDAYRKKGTSAKVISTIKRLLTYPGVDLEINSVFTPKTINRLSESIEFIMEFGVADIAFSLSVLKSWEWHLC